MDDLPDLNSHGHWRMAVWALRVGCVGLVVAFAGLILMFMGSTPWFLAAGMIVWLAAAVVLATGFLQTLHEIPEPRPGFWSMRFELIHDSIRSRPPVQRC